MKSPTPPRQIGPTFLLMILSIGTLAAGLPRNAAAQQIPVAAVSCSTCQDPGALLGVAQTYFSQWDNATPSGYVGTIRDAVDCSYVTTPPGGSTVVMVVSTAIAISGSFYACWIYPHGSPALRAYPISGSTFSGAISQDNQILSRVRVESGPVTFPSNLPFNGAGGSSIPELWEQYLSDDVLTEVPGSQEFSLWHMITGAPTVERDTFINNETGKSFDAWNTDTVVVTDSNGWTAKFQFTPGAPYNWMYVPNSIRDQNGNPPAGTTGANVPSPGGTPQPVGWLNFSLPTTWGNMPFDIELWFDNSTPGGTITVEPLQCPCSIPGALEPTTVQGP